jgi:hypothetical protein
LQICRFSAVSSTLAVLSRVFIALFPKEVLG